MPSLKHSHTYKRRDSNHGYYFCIHPKCSHVSPKDVLEGKLATCPECFKEFKIVKKDLTRKKVYLRCEDCKKGCERKEKIQEVNLEDMMKGFLEKRIEETLDFPEREESA